MSHTPRTNAEPVLIAMSILAFLQLLFAGAGFGELIGVQAVAAGMAMVGAAQGGIQFWVRHQVVATDNVVAQVDPAGQIVAGPALTDVDDGASVYVTPATSG